jgi:hypothetical protein
MDSHRAEEMSWWAVDCGVPKGSLVLRNFSSMTNGCLEAEILLNNCGKRVKYRIDFLL